MSSSVVKGDLAQSLPRLQWRSSSSTAPEAKPAVHGGSVLVEPLGARRSARGGEMGRAEEEAFARGFREGEAAGARQSLEQFQNAAQALAQSAAALASYKSVLRAEVERELVGLALAISRKILRRELSIDPNIVLAVVKSCLDELQNAELYRLRLNPQDVQTVAAHLEQHRRTNVEVVPDRQISRGGAVFETAQGRLDARLENQLAEIERGLADR